eukprot:CAMPEP_0173324460 /NCGR_PEP_ID=MMETSP1143-20121109/31061_1 /TAXON_ID=483371 /ORGANISM="non described non described, Strain CCMP2298" /LENGTH=357 /DNA_ID=CAMNT_0014268491 /DNA_START=40 /DNA_END=1109 /DNA_ORIENTATION=-
MVLYGQVVVGPPGSGKTTYCHGMQLFCQEIGRRAVVVNLDFANDASALPYTPAVDVRDLVTLQEAMETHSLGPNGGLMFCMEELGRRVQWLEDRLRLLEESAYYVIFDCPGQVELYSHHSVFQRILQRLCSTGPVPLAPLFPHIPHVPHIPHTPTSGTDIGTGTDTGMDTHTGTDIGMEGSTPGSSTPMGLGCRLCSVHLVDAFYCCQPATFISAVLLATCTMLRLGLPHVNVLSKVDLASQYGPLPFQLSFFTECMNLAPLLRYIDGDLPPLPSTHPSGAGDTGGSDEEDEGGAGTGAGSRVPSLLQRRFHRMSSALCEVVDDFGLVSFHPMNVQDAETVGRVLAATDSANGFSVA